MQSIHLGPVTFNPASQHYEARIDVQRGGRMFRYPCRIAASSAIPADQINTLLVQQALAMSDTPKPH